MHSLPLGKIISHAATRLKMCSLRKKTKTITAEILTADMIVIQNLDT